jgi:exopolysaccharide biosynthesis polyprenyl glycosylphosphotransferase
LRQDRALERWLLIQDVAVVVLSIAAADVLREILNPIVPGLKPPVPPSDYAHLLLVFLPAWALGAERNSVHRIPALTGPPLDRLRGLLLTQAWGAVSISLILVAAQAPLNRSLIALFLLISTVLLAVTQVAQRRWVERHRGRALALVVGRSRGGRAGELENLRGRRVEVLEVWTPEALRARLSEGGVDEVVVAPAVPRESIRPLLEVCDESAIPVLVALERMDLELRPPRAEVVGRTLYLTYERAEPDRPALVLKAVLDRVASALALAITLPVLLLIGVLVRLTSRGPALFVQQRGGLFGHPFPMLKFRTMREGAEAEREALLAANEMDGPVFKIARDPRVTALGALLRRTSLDELPQLVNVVLGHMSLVGPRPLPVVETRALTGPHRRRLSMRPGITGPWQVSGRNDLGFAEWMALDLEYVDNWSLALDVALLFRTVPALLSRRGAR